MSAPYLEDERNARAREGEYADELLLMQGPPVFNHCEECDRVTPHQDYCDEDGSNQVLACAACYRIAKFY